MLGLAERAAVAEPVLATNGHLPEMAVTGA
jgi:hypothetical protein